MSDTSYEEDVSDTQIRTKKVSLRRNVFLYLSAEKRSDLTIEYERRMVSGS